MNPLFKQLVRRLSFLFLTLVGLVLLIAAFLFTYDSNPQVELVASEEIDIESWDPQDLILNNSKADALVKTGYLLVAESAKHLGPLAENPEHRYAGNHLSCTNCHLNGGTLSGSASWLGITERFPQFRGRENKIGSIEERINGCMERSMNGTKLPENSNQMNAIVAYMKWIDKGLPKLNSKVIQGYPAIEIPKVAVDLVQGKEIYQRECTLCHGAEGKGIKNQDGSESYLYPPLWGEDSYNDGAGMHRVLTAAAFIKNNMPYLQASWDNPKLSDEEAFHVAGYMNSFQRPEKQNKTADFPDKKLKPVSTAYGPWTDDFSAEQHKYGPFPPIIAYYQATFGLRKTK